MDMMTRRAIMSNDNYIKDGLVLWMDGIDKGNVSRAWVDKANGHIFTNVNGMTNGSNYVGLDSSEQQHFRNNTFTPIPCTNGTIEVVIDDYGSSEIVFMPHSQGISFGIRSTGDQIIWHASKSTNIPIVSFPVGAQAFSICLGNTVVDGASASFSNESCWLGPDGTYNYIGKRNYGANNFFNGKIYSIRMYNRQLTSAEMIHNQRVDNQRFHLGLAI